MSIDTREYAGAFAGRERRDKYKKSNALRSRAHAFIPGGAHTYAKGDDQYPLLAPGFVGKGSGCRVWDIDGNAFIEYGMGLRAVTLGHAFPPVVAAATRQMLLGANFTRPSPLEVECAEHLLEVVPGAEMAKFTRWLDRHDRRRSPSPRIYRP